MATWYGQTPGDVVTGDQNADGKPDVMAPGAVLTIWSRDKSTQIVDLLDKDGNAVTQVAADEDGRTIFAQPADNAGSVWGEDSDGVFWLFEPNFIEDRITSDGTPVTDHGALDGLADDDHEQYFNQTRGDARYYRKPSTGIPKSDLASAVQTVLDNSISKGLVTTKGDIFVATAAGTLARLPIGDHDGMILTTNASTTTGLQWADFDLSGFAAEDHTHEGLQPTYLVPVGSGVPAGADGGDLLGFYEPSSSEAAWGFGTDLGGAGGTDVTTATITLTEAVAAGTLIVVGAEADAPGGTSAGFTCADSKGNTYSSTPPLVQGSTNQVGQFYATATTALAIGDTITVTATSTRSHLVIKAGTVTGAATTSRLDKSLTNGSSTAQTSLAVGPTAATTDVDEIAVAFFGFNVTDRAFAPSLGWTQVGSTAVSTTNTGSTARRGIAMVYRILTATGPVTASGTLSPTGAPYAATLGTYRKASA